MLFRLYDTANDIAYTPEGALQEGLGMVKTLKAGIDKLELGSKLRKDVWLREIDSLLGQGAPTMMIAICGATGAGKSSILNAILDDNIVPTSGMRACTAVVTEIAYHVAPTIDADVSFLSEAEWRQELAVLLDDLVDEDGNLKRTTDLRSDAGVAWHKVHAVYPSISQEQLVHMTVDQILARDKKISRTLGTTKEISAKNSTIFSQEISKYIDSKDQKRGNKKDKNKTKASDKSLISKFAKGGDKGTKKKDNGPALWPLIRQVNVRCNAKALSTGAILVDLPGVADANAARNSIAKDYMKKCDCIWILAPITRAVDDKTARDLLGEAFKLQLMSTYDAHTITFIASKCDDVSCSEVIFALGLEDDPELEEIEGRIEQYKEETEELKEKKADASSWITTIEKQLKGVRGILREYEEHKTALENGKTFTPRLTAKASQKQSASKKRKHTREDKSRSPKRHKSSNFGDDSDDDDFIDDLDEDEEQESDEEGQEPEEDEDEDDRDENEGEEGEQDAQDDGIDDEPEEVTVEVLKTKIEDASEAIKVGREQLNEARKARKDAVDALSNLKKKETEAQRDKNAFCSLKRSEFSRDVLKEDFRVGLKDLDDAAAEERNPDSFDPTQSLRNYDEIDLPVFTCSSRDYVRITGQVKGDGDPSCFSNFEDTGIPALQQWCHQLTVSGRSRTAKQFHTHLKTFANSVQVYVNGIGDVTAADREALRDKWESIPQGDQDLYYDDEGMLYRGSSEDPLMVDHFRGLDSNNRLFTMNSESSLKVDARGEPIGVTPRLVKEFGEHIEKCVSDLQSLFRDGLEDKCQVGATNAAENAVQHVDEFAASMHWVTYRATLRRHGSWRRDLNVELLTPFTRNIASSWSTLFESDLFTPLSSGIMLCVKKLLADVKASAAAGLKDHTHAQSSRSQEESRLALGKTMGVVKEALGREQKEISRCLAPHVQNELAGGYNLAMEERGRGSVARQKTMFHNYVDSHKHDVFEGGAEVLMGRLSAAAENIGKALSESLRELAEKVEVSLSVLWESTRDAPDQVRARAQIIQSVFQIHDQLTMWSMAAERVSTTS
ncbi:hypothetical protein M405DRAFT_897528 [Rhizopogon salebrosus TDB-379]|nr:hypothetical protein M405DRAFT_897528 [Rhizopogon salebrosus TDB-379]